jgi:site-specific DNA recombinase
VQGYGFDPHEEACRAYAKKAEYEIVGTFQEEGVSGRDRAPGLPGDDGRHPGQRRQNRYRVNGMDRLARELRIQEALLVYMAAKGVTSSAPGRRRMLPRLFGRTDEKGPCPNPGGLS